jgi:nicotinamide-nucleotide amidase
VNIEIINTGSELMLGRVLNSHQQWLCRQFADHGYTVNRQVAVDDSGPAIQQAVREAMAHADLILVTGGLGATSDDRTRQLIAQLLGRPLQEDSSVVTHIEQFFARRQRAMPLSTRVQAQVPGGAIVLMNAFGTAPGLMLDLPPRAGANRPGLLAMLPGPPRELRPMFASRVLPRVLNQFPRTEPFVCHTLRTTGLGESQVEEKIAEPLRALTEGGLELGYCARPGEVDVRFTARGANAQRLVDEAQRLARERLGDVVFGAEEELLEAVVVRLLAEHKQTVALAESCTGGLIAHRLTNVPGASAVLLAGLVTYSNEAKQKFLGVRPETLAAHGAVSEPVAREMAEGARAHTGADFAVAVTGIAGPSGGSAEKPVGTVFLALSTPTQTLALKQFNPWERETFKYVTSQQALNLLRRRLTPSERQSAVSAG